MTEFVTVSELATMMDVSVTDVITACMNLGLMVSINQRLDAEALVVVAEEFGFQIEFVTVDTQEAINTEEDKPEDLVPRPRLLRSWDTLTTVKLRCWIISGKPM